MKTFFAVLLAGCLGGISLASAAPTSPEPLASQKLQEKLDEAEKNQSEIIKHIAEIKQELGIVKIRATRRANPA